MEVEWKDEYKIGNKLIDGQHEHLFCLANALLEANNLEELVEALISLYKHTQEHFAAEESLMRQYNYPNTTNHILIRNNLLVRLNKVSESVKSGLVERKEITNLMVDWSLKHIPTEDLDLINYIKK